MELQNYRRIMNYKESRDKFNKVFKRELGESEIRELLLYLHKKGESSEEIAGAMEAMKSHSVKVIVDEEFRDLLMDNCGTGGDKSGSFNISTTTSFVLAGAGSYVAKHGNRSITSRSGSADVLEKLGFNFNLSPIQHAILLQSSRFTFMFAQNHHPAMKYIMPIRKSIPHRTIFNILGPLTNPADVKKQLVGVFSKEFLKSVGDALQISGTDSFVVSSRDGLDEVSISDITYFYKVIDGKKEEGEIDPEKYGFHKRDISEIRGGDAKENAETILGILENRIFGAKRDIVILNSAVALIADKKARDIQDGIEMAKDSIESGKALRQMKLSIDMSRRL
jgi:anthranilate phosphoribosyltransferase